MARMGLYARLFPSVGLLFRQHFLMNAQVENQQGGNPEDEYQVFICAPPEPVVMAGELTFFYALQQGTGCAHHILW
jgi:hypothetical protein